MCCIVLHCIALYCIDLHCINCDTIVLLHRFHVTLKNLLMHQIKLFYSPISGMGGSAGPWGSSVSALATDGGFRGRGRGASRPSETRRLNRRLPSMGAMGATPGSRQTWRKERKTRIIYSRYFRMLLPAGVVPSSQIMMREKIVRENYETTCCKKCSLGIKYFKNC